MKKIILFLTFIFLIKIVDAQAQAPTWAWAKGFGGSGQSFSSSIATDALNNVIIIGTFDADTIYFSNDTLFNAGGTDESGHPALDIFIAKYDEQGNALWARSIGGTENDFSYTVKTDPQNNIIVTGIYFSPYITFQDEPDTLLNKGIDDIFIAKYDPAGNLVWTHAAGGARNEDFASVATDQHSNVYLTGNFQSDTLILGTDSLFTYDTVGFRENFVAKYNDAGNLLWIKSFLAEGGSITIDKNDDIILFGTFNNTLVIGNDTLTSFEQGSGTPEFFIAKFDTAGSANWAKSSWHISDIPSSYWPQSNNYANCVTTDNSNNIFITGGFECYKLSFGTDTFVNSHSNVMDDVFFDIYIAGFDENGNYLWSKHYGGPEYAYGTGITTDAYDNVIATGLYLGGTLYIDSLNVGSMGTQNFYVVKFTQNGNLIWAIGGDTMSGSWSNSITTDNNNDILISGQVNNGFAFGNIVLNSGALDAYAAKLSAYCSSYFYLYPDTVTLHNYYAVNMSWGVQPLSYIWEWGDGTYDTTAYPSHTYSNPGFYNICLTITDAVGCTHTYCDSSNIQKSTNTMVTVNVISPAQVGIHEIDTDNSILIFPNPANNNITIISSQNSGIEILNIEGQLIKTFRQKEATVSIDISSLSKGLYFIRVKTDEGITVRKFIKE